MLFCKSIKECITIPDGLHDYVNDYQLDNPREIQHVDEVLKLLALIMEEYELDVEEAEKYL